MKTVPTGASVDGFLAASGRDQAELGTIVQLMREATGAPPVMWGDAIVGFGERSYTTSAGVRSFFQIGFAPRSRSLALYGLLDDATAEHLLPQLGRHRRTKACLHITSVEAIDVDVLRAMMERAVRHWRTSETEVVA